MGRVKRRPPVRVTIDNLSHEGRGVARNDGKTVFVRGALPGEEVVARIIRRRASFDEAVVEEILTASDDRVEPKCPHAGVCGGCSLQHLSATHQIEHKQAVMLELLAHHADVQPIHVLAPLRGLEWGYRRKARLGVKYVEKKGGALVGFREQASPYVADMTRCEVLDPAIGARLVALRELVNSLSIRARIPQIEVAIGDDTVAIVIRHLDAFSADDRDVLASFECDSNIRVYLQSGGEDTVVPLTAENGMTLNYAIDDIEFDFLATDFTQVNADINRRMIAKVCELLELTSDDRILDLYCGLGNFSLPVAKKVSQVTGIEGSMALVERARHNANANAIQNCQFEAGDLADEGTVTSLDVSSINKLILDPPRTGADVVVKNLNFRTVERIVYVSCNPVTLARDVKDIVQKHKFTLTHAGVMDMFPHTAHVESIAVFSKR